MKKISHGIALFASLFVAWAAMAEKMPFERYQTILDRQPFGQPPVGFDPMKNPNDVTKNDYKSAEPELTQSQEEIQKAIHFSVINVENDGTVMVGFSDKSDAKSPKHYYMAVGTTRDNWLVKEADPAAQTMTIEKDGVEVELSLGENTTGVKGGKQKAAVNPKAKTLANRTNLAATSQLTSRKARKEAEEAERKREAERLRRQEEMRKAEEEERALREAEDKAQREQDRAAMREQLSAIQEELRRGREEKEKRRREEAEEEDSSEENETREADEP